MNCHEAVISFAGRFFCFGRFAALVLLCLVAYLGRAQQLLLSDNFNSGSVLASTFNSTLAADQGGLLAPVNYTVTTGGQDFQAQHGNGSAMLLAGDSGYGATASLNCNFAALANVVNSPLQIRFDGYVDSTTNAGCWFSFAIGSAQNILANATPARFGILPTWDGNLQVRAGGTTIQSTTHTGNNYSVVLANTAGTGSAFNGSGSVVKLYNGATLINTYTLSQLGTGDGYISFGSNPSNGAWNLAHVDNLSLSNLTGTVSDVFLTWNAAVSYNWNTTQANWTGAVGVWNNSLFGNAIFGAAGVGTVTLTEAITARSLTFNTAGYTLTGGSLALTGPQAITNNANATIASPIVSGTLTKYGTGTLTLTGLSTNTGGTTVNAGTLQLVANYGNCPIKGTLTVNPGAMVTTTGDGTGLGFNGQQITTLNINGGTVSSAGTIHIWNQSGGVNLTGGTLQSNGGTNSASGGQLEWGDTVVNTYASVNTSVIAGRINLRANDGSANASLLQLNVADGPAATDLLIGAAITETGLPVNATTGGHCGISKTGAGTLRMTGSVQITGVISVEAGTLDFAPSALNTNARIFLASSARLLLSAAGTNAVKNLYLDGVKLAAGRWGAPGSVAAGTADYETPVISGSGIVLVTDSSVSNRERWKRMKYGQFTHYTYFGILPDGTSYSDVNFAANNFNAAQYANDLQSMGVEYVIFTAWHANFVPVFNSAAVVRALGYQRGSTRDMIGDMLAAVRAKGIRVLFYTHPNQPVIYDYTGHNNMINDVYGEVVDRYGDQIDGFYLDENDPGGNQNSFVDFPRLERTIHRRNPDLILLQNFYGNLYSCDLPIGESGPQSANLNRDVAWASVTSYAQVMSATWLVSVPTNTFAATRSPQGIFRAAVMAAGTCTEGGGWAWAAGPFPGGLWEQGVLEAMQGAAQLMAPVAVAITNTFPSTSWPTFGGVFITSVPYGIVATRSVDDAKEYIHVLNPPSGNTLTLPPAADGKVFTNARLLVNSNAVTLSQSSRGVQLTLTGTNTWNTNDTVIALDVVTKGDRGIYNNTSPTITYTGGSWSYQGNRNLGEYRNDVQVATANGDSFTFTFSGTDVSFISSRGAGRGVVALYLDGVLQTNLDLSVGTTNRDAVFSLTALSDGAHTLTGVKVSGSFLYVDAFKVSEMLNDSNAALTYGTMTRFNDNATTSNSLGYITYTGSWSGQTRYGGEYGGDITYSQTLGDYFTINFNGTGVRMIGDGLGTISFYLDGTFIKTVDMSANGGGIGVVGFDTNGLALGNHQLKGVFVAYSPNSSAPWVQVDEFDVYNAINSQWSYQAGRNLGDYQNDIHITANTFDSATLSFTGTGIDAIAPASGVGGTVQVTVDGSVVENVNQYAGDLHAQATSFSSYNAASLTPGNHQLRLLKTRNFGSLALDAVRIYKGETVASAPVYWGATGGGGSGTWDIGSTTNWWDGANTAKWFDFGGVDYSAVFGGTAGTVSLAANINVNQLTFNTTGYTLQNNTLAFNGSNPGLTVASNVAATIGSSLTGSAGLSKGGAGTLTLTGINSYSGGTTVNGGTLELNGAMYGNGLVRGTVTVNPGANLALTGGDGTGFGWNNAIPNLTINGGLVNASGGSHIGFGNATAVVMTNGASIAGSWQWNGDGKLNFSSSGDSMNVISGYVFLRADDGANHTFNVADGAAAVDLQIDANLSNNSNMPWQSPALIKTGVGTLVLSGSNSYTGPTTVSGGTLLVNGSLGTNAVAVGAAARLGGSGVINGPVTVQSGATLAPGASIGVLTINKTLTLAAGSQTVMELNAAAHTNDLVKGLTSVTYGGTLVLTNLAGSVVANQTFTLFSAASRSGSFSSITPTNAGPGLLWSFNPTNGVLTAVATFSLVSTNIAASLSGTSLTLSWPADHIGWTLLMQTNGLNLGLSANSNDWMRVPGSANTNQVKVSATQPSGFYRLVYP